MTRTLFVILFSGLIGLPALAEKLGSNHPVPGEQSTGDSQQGKRRGPPPEALEACSGKAAGDACTFVSPRKDSISGKCDAPRKDAPLACRPEHRKPPKEKPESSN